MLPIGYGDGFPRVRNQGFALLQGKRVPIVGGVAMDALTVDLTDVPAYVVTRFLELERLEGIRDLRDRAELLLHDVAGSRVVHKEERRLGATQVVQAFPQSTEEERGGELLVAKRARVPVQPIHGFDRDQQRNDEDYRNREEAKDEPRSQGHFVALWRCEGYPEQLQVRRRGARPTSCGLQMRSSAV